MNTAYAIQYNRSDFPGYNIPVAVKRDLKEALVKI